MLYAPWLCFDSVFCVHHLDPAFRVHRIDLAIHMGMNKIQIQLIGGRRRSWPGPKSTPFMIARLSRLFKTWGILLNPLGHCRNVS